MGLAVVIGIDGCSGYEHGKREHSARFGRNLAGQSYRTLVGNELSGRMPDSATKMLALPYLFASFAQVSLNVTIRFHACFSAVESGSSAK